MTGTIFSTKAKGVRYLELTEGYILQTALDKDNQVIGYKFVHLGKMMDAIRPRHRSQDRLREEHRYLRPLQRRARGAVKWIDPREE